MTPDIHSFTEQMVMENLLCARHGGLSPDVLGLMSAQHVCLCPRHAWMGIY